MVNDSDTKDVATKALSGLEINWAEIPYGDIWLRDTAPIFTRLASGKLAANLFGFNGWGNKYLFESDLELSDRIALALGVSKFRHDLVLE